MPVPRGVRHVQPMSQPTRELRDSVSVTEQGTRLQRVAELHLYAKQTFV